MSVIDDIVRDMVENNPHNTMDADEINNIIDMVYTMVWCDCNRVITPVSFFNEVVRNEGLCDILIDVCGFENIVDLSLEFAKRYPKIVNSKNVIQTIKELVDA